MTKPLRLRVGNHWPQHLYRVHPDGSQTPIASAFTPEDGIAIAEAVNARADEIEGRRA